MWWRHILQRQAGEMHYCCWVTEQSTLIMHRLMCSLQRTFVVPLLTYGCSCGEQHGGACSAAAHATLGCGGDCEMAAHVATINFQGAAMSHRNWSTAQSGKLLGPKT